jgi:hypothetical protein
MSQNHESAPLPADFQTTLDTSFLSESQERYAAARSTTGRLPRDPNTPMQHYGLEDEVDAVVIGTGAGGSPILARLARAIEAG